MVLAESYRAAGKQALEVLGHYNPRRKDFAIKDQARLNYWLGKHVSVSPTVHNLLVEKKLITSKKVKAWQPKKKESVSAETDKTPGASAAPAGGESPAAVETPAVEPQA